MSNDYLPLKLPQPEFFRRTNEQGNYIPPSPEIMKNRQQIAAPLKSQVADLSAKRINV
ncbi:MAG: hypothetical protein LBC02_02225 [Planctomycetaceae bacterium]|jgi:hypothetical protein|nr:hypothetical protein [Planctomycetaceae bacterium]